MPISNPRSDISLEGLLDKCFTYKRKTSSTGAIDLLTTRDGSAYTTTQYGYSVSMSSSGTVKVGADGDVPIGKLLRSEPDDIAVVQTRGTASFSYVAGGTAPVVGSGVICNGTGGVKVAPSGTIGMGVVESLDATNLLAWVDMDKVAKATA